MAKAYPSSGRRPARRSGYAAVTIPISAPTLMLFFLLPLVTGCDWQPKGSTLFIIEGKREYDTAQIIFPQSGESRAPVKLRWVDSNQFITTATFSPTQHTFFARNFDGFGYMRAVTMEPGKTRYVLPERADQGTSAAVASMGADGASGSPGAGGEITGTLAYREGRQPSELIFLFIASDVNIRRAPVNGDGFSIKAPAAGTYRLEIVEPGKPPRTWARDNVDLTKRADLGVVELRGP